ncbi:SGNH/GDSL hydrolase family protein [Nonomuraea terrae]|uniref:SGNH/GDSL hydrolase family protein n=1 Tax=Nonomuraea terrae TaxID=2530383 RepID=A0A4R4YNJ1_9ACTN|nr:SGNH/GDSL hydrolase family protein [Nonomuraea terrae]TDD46668.1 SGNH/GDSL hydrolase family protein [Nonomuraea terrae]
MIARLGPALAAVAVLSASGTAHAATAQPVPEVMAALGDSISTGFNACGWYVSCTSRSWSAGDNADVRSHYLRLSKLSATLSKHNLNFAAPGSTSADLLGQVRKAVAAKADYVTILVGAQDACRSTEQAMTSVRTYRQRMDAALAELRAGMPRARVFVASIPDLRRLWQVGRKNPIARTFWTIGRVCPSMLADPISTKRADTERRDRVRARVMAYNRAAAQACAAYGPACRTDGGAIFDFPFTLDHVSKWDFFHPNSTGQRVLAEQTFKRGFSWIDPR